MILFKNNHMWIYLLILLPLLFIVSLYYYKYHLRPKRLIKWYRDTLEGLGYNVLVFPYDPHKIMLLENQRHNAKEYGDAMYDEKHNYSNIDVIISNTSYMVTLILLHPRLIKHMFTPEKNYIIQKSHLNKYGFKLAMGTTMIMNQGDVWKNKRKVFSEVFNFQFVKRNLDRIKTTSLDMLKEMEGCSLAKQTNEEQQYTTDLRRVFGDIISNVIIRGFFGGEGSTATIEGFTINQYLGELLKDARTQSTDKTVLLFGQKAYDWGLGKKYRELTDKIARLKSEVKTIIDRRKKLLQSAGNLSIERYTDIFEAMWIMKAKGGNKLSPEDENEIIEQFCAFMAAGNDSSSLYTTMIFYYLNENPEVEAKLRKEIDANIPTAEEISFSNLKGLRYLEWVQNEVTRMYGPATSVFLREVVQDTNIDNIPIMKGTGLKIELLPSHYNQKYFKNPNKFDPERWNTSEEVEPYSYGGFSFGPRSCIGKHLALFATKIIVVTLLKRYKKIQIVKDSQIRFEFKGFYMPTAFQTTLTKSIRISPTQ